MPCYNAAETIDETMESLCSQTLTSCEFVVIDDGSQDSTVERLQAWAARDARVRLIRITHAGIIEALNTGFAACRADLIARMDADDLARPQRLEKQADFLELHPDVAAVGCLVEGFPAHTVREGFKIYIAWLNSMVTSEEIARGIFIESPLAHPSVMIRRSWLERMGGYQENGWAEDYDLWLRMHLAGARFSKVPEVLLEWREHPRRLTRTDSRYSVENFLRAKARYLVQGPLNGRDAVIVWGAGQMGRRLSKHLEREGAPLVAFIDIDPKKIGSTRRGKPIITAQDLPLWWERFERPIVLAAVGSRGARALIGDQLVSVGLNEGDDWWAVA